MPGTTAFLRRIVVGLWLALFLQFGFDPILWYRYIWSPPWIWVGCLVYGLTLGVPLLVIASKRVASLGPVKLTVCAGFVLVLARGAINLAYGNDWFGMYTSLDFGTWAARAESGWINYFLVWLQYQRWVSYRLITYLGLGYVLAKGRGIPTGIVISTLVALVDSSLGWLVFLPQGAEFDTLPLSIVLQYERTELVKALLAQTVDLSLFAFAGVLVTLIRWPRVLRHSPRFVVVNKTRRRPTSQLTDVPSLD